ncbi:hypothetical protein Tco_1321516 [Tanacetum coccineum]
MIQNSIKIDSMIAQEMFDELIWVIESRPDVVEARKIRAMKGLAEAQLQRATLDVFKFEESQGWQYPDDLITLLDKQAELSSYLQNCSQKYGRDVFKNERALNADASTTGFLTRLTYLY